MRVADIGVTINFDDLRKLKEMDSTAKIAFVDSLVKQLEWVWKPLPCKQVLSTGHCSLTNQICPSVTPDSDLEEIVWVPRVTNECPSYAEGIADAPDDGDEAEEASTETEPANDESVQTEEGSNTRDIEVDGKKAVLEVNTGDKDQVLGRIKHTSRLEQAEVQTTSGTKKFAVVGGDDECSPGGRPKGAVVKRSVGKPSRRVKVR